MRTSNPKPAGLSTKQSLLWDAVTTSPHSLNAISKRSGYSEQSIRNWINGVFDTNEFTYSDVMQAIQALENEAPTSINWTLKKPELVELKRLGMSNVGIARRMKTSRLAIERASKRLLAA